MSHSLVFIHCTYIYTVNFVNFTDMSVNWLCCVHYTARTTIKLFTSTRKNVSFLLKVTETHTSEYWQVTDNEWVVLPDLYNLDGNFFVSDYVVKM